MNIQQSSAYSSHDEVWSLLPWYANGSLEGPERDRVKAHLQVCLVCRRELASQATLAKHLGQTPGVEISYKPSFERLMSRLHQEQGLRVKANGNRQAHGKTQWLAHWKNALMACFATRHYTPAVAAGLLAIAIAWWFNGMPPDESRLYTTVAKHGSLERFTANDITVVFADQATRQEIDRLVGSIDGRIVGGPNPVGAYTVRLAGGVGKGASLAQALGQLKGNQAVVLAEPALPPTN